MAQTVKNLPIMQETWVQSPGQEDPLEEGMATHCSILAWKIPSTEEPGRLQSMGLQSWTQLSNLQVCNCVNHCLHFICFFLKQSLYSVLLTHSFKNEEQNFCLKIRFISINTSSF